jgi:DNA-binding XRE family transcriptional regulator
MKKILASGTGSEMPYNALASDESSVEWKLTRTGRGPVSCESERTTSVLRADFFQHPPIASGFSLLNDLLSELADDPAVIEARRELGQEIADSGDAPSLTVLRLKKGLSQKQLADAIGTSQAAVSRLEAGEQEPRLTTLRKLAAALEVDLDTLAGAFPDE